MESARSPARRASKRTHSTTRNTKKELESTLVKRDLKFESPAVRKTRRKDEEGSCWSPISNTSSPVITKEKKESENLCSTPSGKSVLGSVNNSFADLFEKSAEMGNVSWAEIVEAETATTPKSPKRRTSPRKATRKQTSPQKRSTQPRFLRNLDLPAADDDDDDVRTFPSKSSTSPKKRDRPVVEQQLRRSPRKRCMKSNTHSTPEHAGASPVKRSRRNVSESHSERPSSSAGTPKEYRVQCHERYPLPQAWKEPKLGWAPDDVVNKRDKDIVKGKTSSAYEQSILVLKKDRPSDVPKTPNKYINYSRRSWDMQVRRWRKMIHIFAGDSMSEIPSSLNTSFSSSVSDSSYVDSERSSSVGPSLESSYQTDPDELAGILTGYEIDSRKGFKQDDNTMPAVENKDEDGDNTLIGVSNDVGPVDFSNLIASK